MSNKPLIQQIIEEDFINKNPNRIHEKSSVKKKKKSPRKTGNEKIIRKIAEQFIESSRYPFLSKRLLTFRIANDNSIGTYTKNDYQEFAIPGSQIISTKNISKAIINAQKLLTKVTKLDRVFNPDNKEAVSWALSFYYKEILAEIENLPRITVTDLFSSRIIDGCYYLSTGGLKESFHPEFFDLCKKLHSKILTNDYSFDRTLGFLSAVIRQIAIRKVALPDNLREALEKINERFLFFAIVPGRVFYANHKTSFISTTIVQQNKTNRLVLHNDKSYAFKMHSRSYYYLRGRTCPKWIIECTEKDIGKRKNQFFILNVEQRRMVLDKLGTDSVIKSFGAKIIDEKDDYKLLEVSLPVSQRSWRRRIVSRPCKFLQMKNPSMNDYHIEGVDNNCKTVDEAIKWRNHGASTLPVALT